MISGAFLPRDRAVRYAAAALLVVAVAIGFGWRAGRPTTAEAVAPALTPWTLPPQRAANVEQDVAILGARRPWGGGGSFRDLENGPSVPAGQPWILVGTILRDDQPFALIRLGPTPSAQLAYLTVGDRLPDGSTLDAIELDTVTTADGPGGRKIYRLFQKKP